MTTSDQSACRGSTKERSGRIIDNGERDNFIYIKEFKFEHNVFFGAKKNITNHAVKERGGKRKKKKERF